METIVVITPLQGVPPLAVVVQPRRPRHEDGNPISLGVVDPLDQVPPSWKLVDLVQHHELLAPGQPSTQQVRADPRVVPVDVAGVPPAGRTKERQGQGRLADLPRPAEEHHLAPEVAPDWGVKVAGE